MTFSKTSILKAIREHRPVPVELPAITGDWTTYPDRLQQFVEVLEVIGGQAIVGATSADVNAQLRQLPIFSQVERIASLVPDIGDANVDVIQFDSPYALENIDIAILPGEFAVAENGAVWVTDRSVPLRALFFICQHLVLVVPADRVVDHLHDAYERIAGLPCGATGQQVPGAFSAPMFGTFIAGPSKTADIEQSLVIGAHGPRSLTVCLLGKTP